ncbi:hypothetical protein AB5I41_27665 [Sphingomonas sp. MMS24-JH45]
MAAQGDRPRDLPAQASRNMLATLRPGADDSSGTPNCPSGGYGFGGASRISL